jgi:hypothetical protein
MLHEFGHLFGLADWYFPPDPPNYPCSYYSGQTTEAQMCGTNDIYNGVPLLPTSCDYYEVNSIYSGTDDPTCGDGGGGGGGGDCSPDGGSCSSDDDCCSGSCDDGTCEDLDPIIIDLTGNGYQLTNAANGVKFDFFGDGQPIQMSWTAAGWNGGFLALDRNGNGLIDDGAELFSNLAPQPTPKTGPKNGFLALAVFDQPANGGNGDGWINAQDAVYSKLLIWVDKNHDGISQPDELFTLKQAGIQAISLSYSPARWTDAYGNVFVNRSQMRTNTSPAQWIYDVDLQEANPSASSAAATKPQ